MDAVIREGPFRRLEEYARIPGAFRVESVVTVEAGSVLTERPVARPWIKDYDAIPGNHPADWQQRFDTTGWRMLTARREGELIGGAVLVAGAPDLDLLAGRLDTAILWDLRVAPRLRRQGIGSAVFLAARRWAADRDCLCLLIETQDINAAACRLYARMGCTLADVQPHAYPAFPHESRLLWRCAPYHSRQGTS